MNGRSKMAGMVWEALAQIEHLTNGRERCNMRTLSWNSFPRSSLLKRTLQLNTLPRHGILRAGVISALPTLNGWPLHQAKEVVMRSNCRLSLRFFSSTISNLLLLSLLWLTVLPLAKSQDVLTYHNDSARTGQNLSETTLTVGNVNSATFGKLFTITADGLVDAQPLYASAVTIAGNGTHNLLIVATEHDSVYAFDADNGASIWKVSLLKSGEATSDSRGCSQVTPEIGVTSTPVIDRSSGPNGAVYVVAMSKDSSGGYHQRLHALDLTTGGELFNGPQDIQATFPGTGDNSSGGYVIFDAGQYKERAGLLLLNGVVYTAWASHCDFAPYTGWIIGYNESTLAQVSVLDVVPNGSEGAIWMAGDGLAADSSGNIYFLDANGDFGTALNASKFPSNGNYGNAFLKLSTSSGLAVADYFEMYNQGQENGADTDLGSGGALVLPDITDNSGVKWHLAVGAGKDTNLYLVNRDSMGKYNSGNNNAVYQELAGALPGGIWSTPAYFNGEIYYGSVGTPIYAFQFSNAKLLTAPVSQTTTSFGYPGATPSISANGNTNGIVWATENTTPAILHAYNATNLQELYNSNQAGSRDHFGTGNKFITSTVANGKVYVGTTTGVGVFGLLADLSPGIYSPASGSTLTGSSATFQWNGYTGATAYWIDIGSAAGGNNYYSSGSLSTTTFSATVSGLPTNGSTIYVTMYSLINGSWVSNAYTFTAYNNAVNKGVITSPVPSSILSGSRVTFNWTAGTGATAYWLDIGNVTGGNNYYSSGNLGNVLTATVNGLPTNGSPVYVTLYSLVSGQWLSNAYAYTAFNATAAAGVLTTPIPGSTLSGSSVTFNWTAGAGATAYWLDVGSTAGGNNYYSSGNLGSVLTVTVSGLPTNGSAVYATLYSLIGGVWTPNAYTYTAFNAAAAGGAITSPANHSTLSGSSVTFNWTVGTGASAYWLDVGSTAGGNNYYSSGNLGSVLTKTVNGLPTNGSTIYVTLYSLIGGVWTPNAYTYTALSATAGLAVMQTPTPGSTLSGNVATFTWSSDSNATAYWVDIGSAAGGNNVYSSGNLGTALTTTVYSLPANGSTIYVTLYSYVGGQWLSNAYTYVSGP